MPINEKVGIRGKFAEQKGEMETDGAWKRNPPEEEERSRVAAVIHTERVCVPSY